MPGTAAGGVFGVAMAAISRAAGRVTVAGSAAVLGAATAGATSAVFAAIITDSAAESGNGVEPVARAAADGEAASCVVARAGPVTRLAARGSKSGSFTGVPATVAAGMSAADSGDDGIGPGPDFGAGCAALTAGAEGFLRCLPAAWSTPRTGAGWRTASGVATGADAVERWNGDDFTAAA